MEFFTSLLAILALYLFWKCFRKLVYPFDYWEKRGVPSLPAVSIVGSMLPLFMKERHKLQLEALKKYGRIFGYYESTMPVLNIAEPELLKLILSRDFHIFPERRPVYSENEISNKIMAQLRGEDWKRVRTLLTPIFTAGKLKRMFAIMSDSAKLLADNMSQNAQGNGVADVKRYFDAYSMDVIASGIFATKLDSFNDPKNIFVTTANKTICPKTPWRIILHLAFPAIRKLFRISIWDPKGLNFFRDVTLNIIEQRKRTGQRKNDFLQLLFDLAEETDSSATEKNVHRETNGVSDVQQAIIEGKGLTTDELVANSVVFFLAGYDTVAKTLAFLTYSIALNPDIQEKLHTEVDDTMEKHNGEITYDALKDLTYMDMVISETLRMYSPALTLEREAGKDYVLGDTGITVPKGMIIVIPLYSLHHDPDLYPDPERFDPERFSPDEKAKRNPHAHLPFGVGPRYCMGTRFAKMEMKIALLHVLSRFNFKRCPETKVPLEFGLAQTSLGTSDITLRIEERSNM